MWLTIALVALAPVLLLQGRRVRKTIVKLPEPEGIRESQLGQGRLLRVLILGDSAGAGVGAPSQQEALSGRLATLLAAKYKVTLRLVAQTGLCTQSILPVLHASPQAEYDVVLVSLGVNDVTSGKSPFRYVQDTKKLVDTLRADYAAKHIIFSSMPPIHAFPALPHPLRWYLGSRAKHLDQALQAFLHQYQCEYIKIALPTDPALMAADGFHPGPKVYQQWAKIAADKIESLFPAT